MSFDLALHTPPFGHPPPDHMIHAMKPSFHLPSTPNSIPSLINIGHHPPLHPLSPNSLAQIRIPTPTPRLPPHYPIPSIFSQTSILHRPLLQPLNPPLQLPHPPPNPPPHFLPILPLYRVSVRLLQLLEFLPRGDAVVGRVDGFLVGFLGGDFELWGLLGRAG